MARLGFKSSLRYLSHSPYPGNGKWVKELLLVFFSDDYKSVRLIQVRSNFCQELVAGNTNRCYQTQLLLDLGFDFSADFFCTAEKTKTLGDI